MTMIAEGRAGADTGFRIKGWHVLAALLGFFGVMMVANVILVYLALSTYPGTVVDSSYKAGRAYPGEIAAAKAQDERAWQVDLSAARASDGTVEVVFVPHDKAGNSVTGLTVEVDLQHPATTASDHVGTMVEVEAGRYVARFDAVRPGNWNVAVSATRGDEEVFKSRNRLFLSAKAD